MLQNIHDKVVAPRLLCCGLYLLHGGIGLTEADIVGNRVREQSKKNANIKPVDFSQLFQGKTAYEVLQGVVQGYVNMNHQEKLLTFYKVIYSERSIQPMAARIVAEETERMIIATKQLFYAMEIHKLLHFENADMSAVSFAMTVHGLMDYELDQKYGYAEEPKNLLDEYLKWFCTENQVEAGD